MIKVATDRPVMEPECTIVTGATGAGKSTWIAGFVKRYQRNVIVFKHEINIHDKAFDFLTEKTMTSYRQGVRPGEIIKCKMAGRTKADWKAFLEWCYINFRHGLVVLDDSLMFERDRPSELFLDFLIMKRHVAMNIFVVYHGLSAIPIEVFTYSQKIILFNTTDNTRYKKDKIPSYEALQEGIQMARNNFNTPGKTYTPVIVSLQ